MLLKFTKACDTWSFHTLTEWNKTTLIEYFGIFQIIMKTLTTTGWSTITLLNVVFVLKFMTNLFLQNILSAKEVCFDG